MTTVKCGATGTMLQGHKLPAVLHPFLRELADLIGKCARLDILYRSESVLQIDEATSTHLIGYSGWTGRRLPLDCTAFGRVFLAHFAY
jgi:DNA-binding IclR family transcriptional regulator